MARTGVPQVPTDQTRRCAFLDALRESGGSFAAACRASAPHLDGKSVNPPAANTWRALMGRDAEFAAQVQAVMDEVRDDIEAEMHRRSIVGVDVPVFQKGGQAKFADGSPAYVKKYSDALLMKRAAALMPHKYGERREVNVNVRSSVGAWSISLEDLAALSTSQKEALRDIIDTVRAHRNNLARIEGGQVEVLDAEDAECEEVEEVDFDLGEEALAQEIEAEEALAE